MLKFNSGTRIWTILETKVRDIFTFRIEPNELVHGKVKFLMGTKEIPFPIPILIKSKKRAKRFARFQIGHISKITIFGPFKEYVVRRLLPFLRICWQMV